MSDTRSTPSGRLVPRTALAVVLGGFVLGPAYLLSRPQRCGDRVLTCAMQVRQLAEALRTYAVQNGGALPPPGDAWADLLIEAGLVTPDDFVSRMAVQEELSSFAYVPAEHLDPHGDRVLVYEHPGLHPDYGVHIAYHDGRVETLAAEDAGAIIARLRAAEPIPAFPPIGWDAFDAALDAGRP